jgi:phosphoserine phosphatase
MSDQLLPSWNEGAAKSAILDFVTRVTKQGGADFVPPEERIAAFDNDGTLWCEQPLQVQFFFLIDRVKELSAKDPAMGERQPFKALLEQDYKVIFELGRQALLELVFATHSGITDEHFDRAAREWLSASRHPTFGRLFPECTYRPQVELLGFLRETGFKTYIVSGGGVDFVRAFATEAYGVPREQVIVQAQNCVATSKTIGFRSRSSRNSTASTMARQSRGTSVSISVADRCSPSEILTAIFQCCVTPGPVQVLAFRCLFIMTTPTVRLPTIGSSRSARWSRRSTGRPSMALRL